MGPWNGVKYDAASMTSPDIGSFRNSSVNDYSERTLWAARPNLSRINSPLLLIVALTAFALTAPYVAAQSVVLSVGRSETGAKMEASDWLEYMTTAQPTTLEKERAANGHPNPYKVPYLGLGNESWDCGGNMSADYYLSQMKTTADSSATSIRHSRKSNRC